MFSPKVSVVIPTYRGEASLAELVDRITDSLGEVDHEIVIVNDSSPDNSWELLQALAAKHTHLIAINLMRNVGQPMATLCGMAYATGEYIATMDDDLQHPPEEIPKLITALEADPYLDAVIGSWSHDGGWIRSLGSRVFASVARIAYGAPPGLRHTAFRAMRRQTAEYMLEHTTRTPIVSSLLLEITRSVGNVEVEHHERQHGQSNFRLRDSIRTVVNNFFQASTLPLVFLSRLGLTVSALSAIVSVVFLVRWAFGVQTPAGWASAFLATSFFGGVILFGIGLLGSYVDIVIREVRRPPRWAVRDITRAKGDA